MLAKFGLTDNETLTADYVEARYKEASLRLSWVYKGFTEYKLLDGEHGTEYESLFNQCLGVIRDTCNGLVAIANLRTFARGEMPVCHPDYLTLDSFRFPDSNRELKPCQRVFLFLLKELKRKGYRRYKTAIYKEKKVQVKMNHRVYTLPTLAWERVIDIRDYVNTAINHTHGPIWDDFLFQLQHAEMAY